MCWRIMLAIGAEPMQLYGGPLESETFVPRPIAECARYGWFNKLRNGPAGIADRKGGGGVRISSFAGSERVERLELMRLTSFDQALKGTVDGLRCKLRTFAQHSHDLVGA